MSDPVIIVTHASFSEERRLSLYRLQAQLRAEAPELEVVIAEDYDRRGSLWCWKEALRNGLATGASHLIWLPDDAVICRDFGAIITACIEARPHDVFDCFVNHELADQISWPWYTTPDGGFVGFAGVMPRELVIEHLAWRQRVALSDSYTNDGGVNLWAMHTGRSIYKTSYTLATHDPSIKSLDGHDGDAFRQGLRWFDDVRDGRPLADMIHFTWGGPDKHEVTRLPRTYRGNHWALVRELQPKNWNLEAMYSVARHGEPLQEPSVLILSPTYRMPQEFVEKTRASVAQVREHLAKAGIPSDYVELRGDALICRVRQRGCNLFLQSDRTHLLWWDADIECLTPDCVKAMIETGHDVIAGAVPFKTSGGNVVCNIMPEDAKRIERRESLALTKGCLEVQDAGSGFMLVSRKALVALQYAHPELLHFSVSKSDEGQPLWALFDTAIVDSVYRSEDYYFCHIWRQHGQGVYVYELARFRHWGSHGYEGSLRQQYGLENAT